MYTYLDGVWNLYYAEQDCFKVAHPSDLPKSGIPCVQATVPGNVELDLSKAGILPADLFYGLNILEAEKYETYEWWYTTTFKAEKLKNLTLHFEAVDCFAEYYVNDTLVYKSDNMFIPQEFDISGVAKEGENTLCVHIRSALIETTNTPTELYSMAGTSWRKEIPSVYARKAPHSYGWDIMPRAISAGIWRSVYVYNKPESDFEQLYLFTSEINDSVAKIGMAFELRLPNYLVRKPIDLFVEGVCGDSTFKTADAVSFKAGCIWFDVENPKLWWPKGYGEPSLYDVKVTAKIEDEIIAEKTVKVGVRTLKLECSDTTDGVNGYFRFIVNGKEIMAKGSNWVPMDAYHSRDAVRYEKALALVKDVGCNMLRCWGGNVYEDHAFYDFCDQNGILIWQDFSMACHAYPRSEPFLSQLEAEAVCIIKRLRQHTCIALWSGDNECDEATKSTLNPNETQIATRKVLKDAVYTHDFVRPYLPSSPFYSEQVMHSRAVFEDVLPERHLWGPRDYFKSDFYKNAKAHFVSETGYHGCPSPESVKKIVTPESVWPPCNKEWYFHSTTQDYSDARVNLMINQIRQLFGVELPETLEEFSLLSQLSQAEAKKFFIERIRNNRPITSGVLWWNLIDGWPQMSDAVVDYFYDKKIAYDYIKISQNPFLICCKENVNCFLPLVACNDTLETQQGFVKVSDGDTDEVLYSGAFSVAENGCKTLCQIPMDYSAKRLLLIEWTANGKTGKNHYVSGMVPFDKEKFKKWYEIIKERIL